MNVFEMNLLVWLFITQLLLLFSAGVCLFAGYLVSRNTPDDWLYRCSRVFWNEMRKRPPRLPPPMKVEEEAEASGEVDEDLARLAAGEEEPAAAKRRKPPAKETAAVSSRTNEDGTVQTMLHVNVVPNARENGVVGVIGRNGNAYNIQVASSGETGLVNKAVIDFLAQTLGVKVYQIQLVKGHYQTSKVLRISGMDPAEVEQRLSAMKVK